jgi:hypothetical protein
MNLYLGCLENRIDALVERLLGNFAEKENIVMMKPGGEL